jgi:hypothetical protein
LDMIFPAPVGKKDVRAGAIGSVVTAMAGRAPNTTPSICTPPAATRCSVDAIGHPTADFRTNTRLAADLDLAAHAGPDAQDAQDAPAGRSDRETCAGLCWI